MELREYVGYRAEEIRPLYESVGWTNYTQRPDMLERAFQNSRGILAAYEGERLVGLLRAVGDGISIVYLQDLLVAPEAQRRGYGTQLVNALLARFPELYQLVLITDASPQTTAFYQSLGLLDANRYGCKAFMKL